MAVKPIALRFIADMGADEKLKEEPARALVEKIFRIGECEPSDAAIAEILPPISRFKAGLLAETKMRVAEKL